MVSLIRDLDLNFSAIINCNVKIKVQLLFF